MYKYCMNTESILADILCFLAIPVGLAVGVIVFYLTLMFFMMLGEGIIWIGDKLFKEKEKTGPGL